jgi:hypothetical protein
VCYSLTNTGDHPDHENLNLETLGPLCYLLTNNGDHPDHDVGEKADPDDRAEERQHEPDNCSYFSLKNKV